MSLDPADLPASALEFLTQRQLASLTTLRRDGSPHVCTVGFTWDDAARVVRVITFRTSQKVRNVEWQSQQTEPGLRRAAVCQAGFGAWLTLEGEVRVEREPDEVAEAVRRYAERYRQPSPNPERVALLIKVDRVLGSA